VRKVTRNSRSATQEKGLHLCNPLILLARPAGFEPTTPWFVAIAGALFQVVEAAKKTQ
jgi:hypothetical protein